VLVACWSPKGGSGTTVVAVLLAMASARSSAPGALLVDLAGDVPAALGVAEPVGPGLGDWLAAAPEVGADALRRLEVDVGPGLKLLARGASTGAGVASALRAEALPALLADDARVVVADCGRADRPPGRELAASGTFSFCVLRPCYLALRRALAADLRPSGVVLVGEPGRALRRRDIEDVLGVPVVAEVPVEAAIARAVDAGLLATRVGRPIERVLERAMATVAG
jgi:hypothetical protein